uniref:tetratricopeptide repeat protein n=1 Tax=uncultured Bilophila sp. TaxID=529385 RepID=UPI0025F250EB|nr:tetratricopeptide repeat protein [uncultured Bilophila sp.]
MEKAFSDKTDAGIRLIWMRFDSESIREGVRLLHEASDAGDPDAPCFLARTRMGDPYIRDYAGQEADFREAASLLRESIRRGSACAVLVARRCGLLTPSVRRDMPLSFKQAWDAVLARASEDPFCQYFIGSALCYGDAPEHGGPAPHPSSPETDADNALRAIPYLEKALDAGLLDAGDLLYSLYAGNRERQRTIVRRCAATGSPYWEARCGSLCYEDGRDAEALRWFEKAARHGQIGSWFDVGLLYERGLGAPKDLSKAAEAYRKSAEQGFSDAQQALGILTFFGRGVPRDPARAAYWLREAAAADLPLACGLLGLCFLRGFGVQQDDGEAFALLTRFADARNEEDLSDESGFFAELAGMLLNGLGELYAEGRAGPENLKEGVALFQEAAAFGDADARRALVRFKKNWLGKWVRV